MQLSYAILLTILLPLTYTQEPPSAPGNDLTCSLCKTVMELLDQYLTDTDSEEAVSKLAIKSWQVARYVYYYRLLMLSSRSVLPCPLPLMLSVMP